MSKLVLTALIVTSTALASFAQEEPAAKITLGIGDKAPALQAGKWIQGDPVASFEEGTIYVVEFWATWCGPCRSSIPHLNAIQEQFKDKGVVVIGQDVWEHGKNAEQQVASFVKKMGKKMTYRVALDDLSGGEPGKMAAAWMKAAGQDGIPAAFVVDKAGKIAWIGHPMSGLDTVLEQVVAGTFDIDKARKELEEEQKKETAARAEQMKMAEKLKPYEEKLEAAFKDKNWDKALEAAGELEKALADTPMARPSGLDTLRFRIMTMKKDGAGAAKLAAAISEKEKGNPMMLNYLSWTLMTEPGLEPRDLDLAQKLAAEANDIADSKDPAILDTLARAHFMKGDKEKAVELQAKSIAAIPADAEVEEFKASLQKVLDSYKKGELPPPEIDADSAE
jgi:thiol-disulfide isomerase/thioredoxin